LQNNYLSAAPNQPEIRLRILIVNEPKLWKLDHNAFLQVTPLRFRRLSAVLFGVNRAHHDTAIVIAETNLIAKHYGLTIRIFHCVISNIQFANGSIGMAAHGKSPGDTAPMGCQKHWQFLGF
jgi:hypothetical protein